RKAAISDEVGMAEHLKRMDALRLRARELATESQALDGHVVDDWLAEKRIIAAQEASNIDSMARGER
nr:hypothetical protein [Hyphomonadaceae bacterium]